MATLKNVDALFTQAVESKKMPGIVAMAATDKGVLYQGAFGRRELGKDAAMSLDTVVWIASMTKAITATAAMQLVERGKLALDAPAGQLVPALATARVLDGCGAGGRPRLRAPKRPITLRHLLTHTAGYAYEIWREEIAKYQAVTNTPGITTCTNAALTTPLLFDPGEQWEYGISIDWAGKMVEAASGQRLDAYLQQNILGPLGLKDTSFKLFPGMAKKWGLSFLINTAALPTGRAAGSLAWAGLANTYFWIDRSKRVCGVFLSQVLPFFDDTAIDLFVKFETEVYRAL